EIIFTARLLNNDKIKGGKNNTTSIPRDIHKPTGSSYETVLGPVGCLAAINKATIANTIVKNTIESLFPITKLLLPLYALSVYSLDIHYYSKTNYLTIWLDK